MKRLAKLGIPVLGMVMMVPFVPASPSVVSAAPATELFISEYVEGSSFNKAIEIFNATGATIDLGAGSYALQFFFNGSSSAGTTIALTGSVANGDVYVVADDGAVAAVLDEADQRPTNSFFNGDDAVVLVKGSTVLDVIGQIGTDPGSEWGTGDASTQNNTIRRLSSICTGDTDGSDTFDPSAEWVGYAQNTFDGLGSHFGCGAGGQDPVINEFSASTTGADVEYVEIYGNPSTDLSALTVLEIEGDSGSNEGTIDEVVAAGTTDSDGFWNASLASNTLENDTITLLLVDGFTGSLGDDLDTDDDGTFDSTPWTSILDAIAVTNGGADLTYGVPALAGNYDGLSSFKPGGASRIPDGVDTDTDADWLRNDFNLAGIPPNVGSPVIGEALNTPGESNVAFMPPPGGVCGDPVTLISAIQGSGAATPLSGQSHSVEAVVTQVAPGLNGFYVQEEAADQDADPATSEGLFVFMGFGWSPNVAQGDAVRATGTVGEFTSSGSSQTQLTGSPIATVCGLGAAPSATPVTFPLAATTDLEAVEGMLIGFPQSLAISEYFNFGRFGQVVVSYPRAGDDRLATPTAVVSPGAAANAYADENARRSVGIDDLRSAQNPDPAIHPGNGAIFDLTNTFRGGDTITGIEGVLDHTFGQYKIQPTTYGTYAAVNPRPATPDAVGGDTRVASMNVLNYFLTLDQSPTRSTCGPSGSLGCRGADNSTEFDRQRAKILSALWGLDADVVGLVELENTTGVEPVADLVAGLNDMIGAGTYDFIDTGTIGTDAIRVGIIYKPAAVTPVGAFAVLDSSVDPRFLDTKNRPALAQTFEGLSGRRVTVAVNHLKSKGSSCNDVGDPNANDGQGNCNGTRTDAAAALADWLASDPTGSGSSDVMIIGDLNAYDHEDPITTLTSAGYTDLVAAFGGENAYSFVFNGQFGYLDHALASSSLVSAVTGATEWHINADEPSILDYDTSFKRPAQDALYEPNAFRSSDHDPVVVGLDFTLPTIEVSVTPDVLWPPNHKYRRVEATVVVADETDPSPTVRLVSVTSNEPDDGRGDGHTVNDIVIIDDENFKLRAERSGKGSGRIYTITYEARDAAGNTTIGVATVSVPKRKPT